jgi:hypothetical protein
VSGEIIQGPFHKPSDSMVAVYEFDRLPLFSDFGKVSVFVAGSALIELWPTGRWEIDTIQIVGWMDSDREHPSAPIKIPEFTISGQVSIWHYLLRRALVADGHLIEAFVRDLNSKRA